jgi:hypothetical protein
MQLIVDFTILQMCVVMRIWVIALAFVAFGTKHILLQNFVSTSTQALLGFWIQWVQVRVMLHNVGGSVKVGRGPL